MVGNGKQSIAIAVRGSRANQKRQPKYFLPKSIPNNGIITGQGNRKSPFAL
jgi:hypothetical protein